jgi:hypothetical protein
MRQSKLLEYASNYLFSAVRGDDGGREWMRGKK